MFSNTLRVRAWRIHDLDTASRRGIDIDLVVTDAVPPYDLEPVAPIKQVGVDDAAGANDEAFGFYHLALQGRRIEAAGHAQLRRGSQQA